MALWHVDKGSSMVWTTTIRDSNDEPVAYNGDEALSGSVWPGGERPALVTLTPTWGAEPWNGEVLVEITSEQSALLVPAVYSVQLNVTDAEGTYTFYHGTLQVHASPGNTPAPPIYTDDDDLRTYAPWIDGIQDRGVETGFTLQCAQARSWLDGVLVNRWKPRAGLGPLDPGYNASLYYGNDTPSQWIRDALAADQLMVSDLVKEIVAKRALYLICNAQLGRNGDHSYQDFARRFRIESEEMLKTLRAEIDTNGDGYAEVVINCGSTNVR